LNPPSPLQNISFERDFEHNGPWTNNKLKKHTYKGTQNNEDTKQQLKTKKKTTKTQNTNSRFKKMTNTQYKG
jgi:hypothetical protein